MIALGLVWGLGLLACEEPAGFSPVTEDLRLDAPDRITIGSAIGVGQVEVPFRVVNAYGATVPGQSFEVQVTGEALASFDPVVRPDALGFGSLVLESEQPQRLELVVIAATGNAKVGGVGSSWIVGGVAPDVGLQEAHTLVGTPSFAARATGGVAYAVDASVFYQRTQGAVPPIEVLTLPDLIVGLTAMDLDRDGYLDLVVWTQTRVVLLRGRGTDGYAWSRAFTTPGARVRGVEVADFDGDKLSDLVVAFSEVDGIFSGAQVLLQDGVGDWAALPPLRRELDISDVTLGDFVGDGLSEVVLLTDQGPYRYGHVEAWVEPDRAWNRIDPDLTWVLDPASSFLPSRDLDGEGTPELIGVGPAASLDDDRHLSFYTIDETAIRFDLGFSDFTADVVDITGDGVDDVVVLVDDGAGSQLRTVTVDADDGGFKNRGLANLVARGPLAIGDQDGDGVRDVAIASDRLWTYDGVLDGGSWTVDDGEYTSFGLSLAGPVHLYDWDQDGRTDVLAVREVSTGIVLQHFEVGLDPDTGVTVLQAYDGGQVSVDDHDGIVKARGLDLAVCDDEHIYLLVDDGETVAYRLRRDGSGGIATKASSVVTGEHIVCGELANGALTAVVSEAGDAMEFNGSFGVVASYNLGAQAFDVVFADVDGTGGALQVCSAPGCSLAAVDLDGDGIAELLEGGDAAVLHQGLQDLDLGVAGVAGAADPDGDGQPDLLLTDTASGSVALFQYAGAERLPHSWQHTRRGLLSAVWYADADADGLPELWFVGDDGTLVHSARSGAGATGSGGDTDTAADTGP